MAGNTFETEPTHVDIIISSLRVGLGYLNIIISLNVIKKCICFLMLYLLYYFNIFPTIMHTLVYKGAIYHIVISCTSR